jgi:hypothetical protein
MLSGTMWRLWRIRHVPRTWHLPAFSSFRDLKDDSSSAEEVTAEATRTLTEVSGMLHETLRTLTKVCYCPRELLWRNVAYIDVRLIIGFCILLRVILIVNNTFCFATIDKVFYYVASVLTKCFGPYIRQLLRNRRHYLQLRRKVVYFRVINEFRGLFEAACSRIAQTFMSTRPES